MSNLPALYIVGNKGAPHHVQEGRMQTPSHAPVMDPENQVAQEQRHSRHALLDLDLDLNLDREHRPLFHRTPDESRGRSNAWSSISGPAVDICRATKAAMIRDRPFAKSWPIRTSAFSPNL
jgi:hypothetical protein